MLNEVRLIGIYQNDAAKITKNKSLLSIVVMDSLNKIAQAKLTISFQSEDFINIKAKLKKDCMLMIEGEIKTKRLNFKKTLNIKDNYYVNVQIIEAKKILIMDEIQELNFDTYFYSENFS